MNYLNEWKKNPIKNEKLKDCSLVDTWGLLGIHSTTLWIPKLGSCSLEQWSPTFLVPETNFMENSCLSPAVGLGS